MGGNVTLEADAATVGRGGGFGINYGSRIDWDGSFEINNVPPGRYTLQARGPTTMWCRGLRASRSASPAATSTT